MVIYRSKKFARMKLKKSQRNSKIMVIIEGAIKKFNKITLIKFMQRNAIPLMFKGAVAGPGCVVGPKALNRLKSKHLFIWLSVEYGTKTQKRKMYLLVLISKQLSTSLLIEKTICSVKVVD